MSSQKSDVLIIGGGIAGLVAAYECLQLGLSVQVLERDTRENAGGLAKWAFGGMALVGTPLQRRMGIKDTPDIALQDWLSFADFNAGDDWPQRWAEAYVNDSAERVYHWLRDKGCRFLPAVNWVERGQYSPGNSVPRYHIMWGTGSGLVQRFVELLRQHPHAARLSWQFDCKVEELIVSSGRVSGCRSAEQEFHGDHVMVATGGINGNLQMVRDNWYTPWGEPPAEILNGSHPFADGHLHDVVSEMGGNVTHLDKMWNYAAGVPHPQPLFDNHGLSLIPCKSALWLDHSGKRIGPEPLVTGFDTNELCRRVAELEKPHTWQLLNRRIARKELAVSGAQHNPHIRDHRTFRFLKETLLGNDRLVDQLLDESDHFVAAPTLAELVTLMHELDGNSDVQLANLEEAAGGFDKVVERGESQWNDDQLRRIQHARAWRSDRIRTCKPKPILDSGSGPLIAIKLRLITRKSLGGIQTDLQSRVLQASGEPIPGLFAIGEAAGFGGGGASGRRSLEGTFLSGCILTARAAADSLAG
jgi:predicted oxidoreductase